MNRIVSLLALLVLLSSVPAFAEDAGPSVISSNITAVTVYSDRARVTREARVTLQKAPTTHAFKKLPGWVDDGSVRISLFPANAGRIVDVRVQRDYLARSTDEAYQKATSDVMEIADQITQLDDELAVLQAQIQHIQSIKVFALDKIPKDAAVRDVKVESYAQVLTFISDSIRETKKARRAIEMKRRTLVPELQARQKRLAELQGLTQLEETTVLVTLAGKSSKKARLELTYMLPGATWEPVHELRAKGSDPEKVELTSYAVVTQTSGEDWTGVKLAFSTQSSTGINRIPQLEALKLGDSHAAARIMQEREQSFHRAQAAFEGQARLWNMVNAPPQFQQKIEVYDNNFDQMITTQSRTAAAFQKLRTRGTSAHFNGHGKPTIRGDGHSVRVRIGETTLSSSQAIVAVPEQTLNAVRTLEMTNNSNQPLLPGKVSLYQDGAFLGLTDIGFVAEGETFAVFMGVADQIKLSRVLDRKQSSIHRKKRTRMKVAFVLTVENLSDESSTIVLTDRVPVSERKEIEVENIKISGEKRPDSKGLLNWKLTLAPKEKKVIRIAYQIEYPPALVQKMSGNRKKKQRSMPAASYDFEEPDVSEQIMNLEKFF
jgi:uncharacterized protein (TIGR02231 family)